ncbi:PepSY domain-containing protein [Undibacter mobilis]|uniref:PepSY domain-containing protein n=1 Tax=Undibacter mobilis TaxID=2292256 RepID=A0A371B6P5_9BRAD|nr:PepSY domain-containing protein [Undibacter mobilis]RDV03224.1 PepSY domain-containing protein [Undibacter mobilis]
MRKIALLTAAAILATSGAAYAGSLGRPCTSAPQNQWLSMQQLQSKLEGQGYTVRKAKLAKACGEFYTIDKNGSQVELFLDPTNGQIVGQN